MGKKKEMDLLEWPQGKSYLVTGIQSTFCSYKVYITPRFVCTTCIQVTKFYTDNEVCRESRLLPGPKRGGTTATCGFYCGGGTMHRWRVFYIIAQ